MFIFGITGPSGSGKSTLCSELLKIGYTVIDADKIAKKIIDNNLDCKLYLTRHFGDDILDKNNNLIRSKLASKAFLNTQNSKILNSITHPFIVDEIQSVLEKYKLENKNIVFLDIPLLFESGLNKICDCTIAIIADEDIRRQRILKRDNINEELINMRFSVQNKEEFYKNKVDYILSNNGEFKDLIKKVYVILEKNIGENNET